MDDNIRRRERPLLHILSIIIWITCLPNLTDRFRRSCLVTNRSSKRLLNPPSSPLLALNIPFILPNITFEQHPASRHISVDTHPRSHNRSHIAAHSPHPPDLSSAATMSYTAAEKVCNDMEMKRMAACFLNIEHVMKLVRTPYQHQPALPYRSPFIHILSYDQVPYKS